MRGIGGHCQLSYFRLALAEGILLSSRGGVNFRSAVLQAPAAFVGSTSHSQQLLCDILGLKLHPHAYLDDAIPALAESAAWPDWLQLDDIDMPLHQRHLSVTIN